MKTYAKKGNAINLFIKAESKEAAEKIFSAPLIDITQHLKTVWFEKNI